MLYNLKHYEKLADRIISHNSLKTSSEEYQLAQGMKRVMSSLRNEYYALTGENYD